MAPLSPGLLKSSPAKLSTLAAGWWSQGENANDVFYNQLHSIDLRLGANPGAVGVMWHPAQGTSVRDMSIGEHPYAISVTNMWYTPSSWVCCVSDTGHTRTYARTRTTFPPQLVTLGLYP